MTKKLTVLFGAKPVWNETIAKNLDRSQFDPTYAERGFDSYALAEYDILCPFRFAEQAAICRVAKAAGLPRNTLVPTWRQRSLAADKVAFNEFLIDNGMADLVPPYGDQAGFPAILKPVSGAFGQGATIVDRREDLSAALARVDDTGNAYLLQSMVPGRLEYATHCIVEDGKLIFDFTYENDMAQTFSIRGVQQRAKVSRPHPTPDRETIAHILGLMGYTGTCCIDYKMQDGKMQIFEMNPRFGASMSRNITPYLRSYAQALGARLPASDHHCA